MNIRCLSFLIRHLLGRRKYQRPLGQGEGPSPASSGPWSDCLPGSFSQQLLHYKAQYSWRIFTGRTTKQLAQPDPAAPFWPYPSLSVSVHPQSSQVVWTLSLLLSVWLRVPLDGLPQTTSISTLLYPPCPLSSQLAPFSQTVPYFNQKLPASQFSSAPLWYFSVCLYLFNPAYMANQSCNIGSLIQRQAFSKRLSKWKVMFFHSFSVSVIQQIFLEGTL